MLCGCGYRGPGSPGHSDPQVLQKAILEGSVSGCEDRESWPVGHMAGSDRGVTSVQQRRQLIFREHEEGPWRKRGSSGVRSQLNRRELCSRADSLGKGLEEGEGWLIGDPLGTVYTEHACRGAGGKGWAGQCFSQVAGPLSLSPGHPPAHWSPRPAPSTPRAPARPNAI